jgi:hypothetical protein
MAHCEQSYLDRGRKPPRFCHGRSSPFSIFRMNNRQTKRPVKIASAYVRTATNQPGSTVDQLATIEKHADRLGLRVVGVYVDGDRTGSTLEGNPKAQDGI